MTPADVTVTFTAQSWSLIELNTTTTPQSPGTDLTSTNSRTYIDVTFAPTQGHTLNTASITDLNPEFALAGAGFDTVAVDDTQAPLSLKLNGLTYRYFLTGNFKVGVVQVQFIGGSIGEVSPSTLTNVALTQSFTVQGPTAQIVNPNDGGEIVLGRLNNRGYLDVPITVGAGNTLDFDSITDLEAEFTITGNYQGLVSG